ncbi:aminotransferase class IV [Clostridium celatum]|uniref:Aminotransferase, class IV n=1 Tax=Clostridium celatum DSM 1785 TaxID=545697 RepID=L1QDR9_9CLOT|nr:aminotransferase class IV [Clostridium celatum]EKY26133.1 aminotransferase, class IV [Clostridium celatum DSM 1785]MCE9654274.1 aminotransferase class IV [Clostridium celatum]MDU3723429.1 aminotransferase class IV [Clostridium celatum]MDU6294685.1 aminotransferase class IV [Clostridium celatum]MDY3359112.1 aminotransferase class IV [Clostridium celatum]
MRKVIYKEDLAIIDSGLFFGRGVFETILVNANAIFLKEHIDRLNKSILALNLGEEISYEEVYNFIKNNDIKNKALKITVTEKNIIYTLREIKYKNEDYENGFNIRFSEVLRNSTSRIVNFKTLNYLENIIEYEICQKEGFNETIFLNEKGFVAEGCTTNVFIIKDNKIFTPKISCGLLPGIIRGWVISNFEVVEKEITKEELLNSDEIFLTNSLVGIIGVSKLDDIKFDISYSREIREKYEDVINGGDK